MNDGVTSVKKIDMNEATRLTRLGRLDEAMAVLRGEPVSVEAASVEPGADATPDAAGFIEMTQTGAGWRAAFAQDASSPAPRKRSAKAKLGGLADLVNLHNNFKVPGGLHPAAHRPLPPGATFDALTFSNAAGSRSYRLYVPSTYTGRPAPLIVMLHGCTQSPEDFAAGTKMNDLAETHGFLVAYPQQSQAANMNLCWNWFNAADQQRDAGEPSIIAGITRQVLADKTIDARRVFVAGLSAGGAMAAIMGATYPELYAAVGVHSGLAVGAAHDMPSAFTAMGQGTKPLRHPRGTALVPTIVFHGDADLTVNVRNGDHVIAQAGRSARLKQSSTLATSPGGMTYTATAHSNARQAVLEHWLVHGAGHAWSGGDASGSYTEPRGPDASAEMVRFFLKQKR